MESVKSGWLRRSRTNPFSSYIFLLRGGRKGEKWGKSIWMLSCVSPFSVNSCSFRILTRTLVVTKEWRMWKTKQFSFSSSLTGRRCREKKKERDLLSGWSLEFICENFIINFCSHRMNSRVHPTSLIKIILNWISLIVISGSSSTRFRRQMETFLFQTFFSHCHKHAAVKYRVTTLRFLRSTSSLKTPISQFFLNNFFNSISQAPTVTRNVS